MWSDGFAGAELPGEVLPFEMPPLESVPYQADRADPMPAFDAEGGGGAEDDDGEKAAEITNRLEVLEREAYEKGFAAGEQAGFAMGEQKAIVLLGKLENLVGELLAFRDRTLREMEPQFVELAMSAARKIIIEELTVNPEAVTRITREALSKMQPQGRITIRTTPALLETISKHKPELLGGHADIVFESDPGAPRSGCVIAGPNQQIVTDIDPQLKNLIKQMAIQLAGGRRQEAGGK